MKSNQYNYGRLKELNRIKSNHSRNSQVESIELLHVEAIELDLTLAAKVKCE